MLVVQACKWCRQEVGQDRDAGYASRTVRRSGLGQTVHIYHKEEAIMTIYATEAAAKEYAMEFRYQADDDDRPIKAQVRVWNTVLASDNAENMASCERM